MITLAGTKEQRAIGVALNNKSIELEPGAVCCTVAAAEACGVLYDDADDYIDLVRSVPYGRPLEWLGDK